jgi:hypothetical protein
MEEQVMESQRLFQYMLVAAALTVTAATTAQPVLAAKRTISEDFAVTSNPGGNHPETANIAVNSANAVINHLRKVEVLLNNGAVARARSVLTSIRDNFRSLQYMKEEAEYALHTINDANEMNDNDVSVLPRDWEGIYSSLDEMEIYAPEVAEKVGESLKHSERHMTTCDIQRTADTLEAVVTELPSSLQPGHTIDRQILLALELLGENQPDIATARSIVQNVLNRLTVVETTAASADEGSGGVG